MTGLLIYILGLTFLIFIHELGHFLVAKYFGMAVQEFSLGFGPALWSKKIGGTIVSFRAILLGGYCKIIGMTSDEELPEGVVGKRYCESSWFARFCTIIAGVTMNFIFGVILITILYSFGHDGYTALAGVEPNSAAAVSGLKVNDEFLDFREPEKLASYVKDHKGQNVVFKIRRDFSHQMSISVAIPAEALPGKGLLGVNLASTNIPKMSPLKAIVYAGKTSVLFTKEICRVVWQLVGSLFGGPRVDQGVQSIVGIGQMTYAIGGHNIFMQFMILASISMNLAVLNLLPIPVLDGGWIVFLLIGFVKKLFGLSPVSDKTIKVCLSVGTTVLLFLMFLVIGRDILRLF